MDTGHPTYIAAAATTQVFIGKGKLLRIIITETAAGAISIYDDTDGTSDAVAVFKASIAEGTYELGIELSTGCRIVSAANSKFTVVTA